MTSLIDTAQADQIRDILTDMADTFAFPIILKKTTYTEGAFQSDPIVQSFSLTAIRDFGSNSPSDRLRNAMGPAGTHELDLYVGWQSIEDAGLANADYLPDIDHNDLIQMEGEIYEIIAFEGVGQMLAKPTFLQIRVKRRFQDPDGASAV